MAQITTCQSSQTTLEQPLGLHEHLQHPEGVSPWPDGLKGLTAEGTVIPDHLAYPLMTMSLESKVQTSCGGVYWIV